VILFDVGGVLLTNGWDTGERALAAEHFNLDLAGFEQRHHAVFAAWERGAISVKAYLDATVFNEPRSFTHYEFFGFMLEQSKPLADGALGTLEELSASNKCLLGALNNEARPAQLLQCGLELVLPGPAQAGCGDLRDGARHSGQAGKAGVVYRRPDRECGRGHAGGTEGNQV
jgi:hypothetical protein